MTNIMTSDQEGRIFEKLGTLISWMERMCKEFDEHIGDHKEGVRLAEDARKTAIEAAQLAAIARRNNRAILWAQVVGALLLGSVGASDIILRLNGH